MNQFLTTALWKSIAAESKKAKVKRAAIAYVTRDLPLSFGDGDTLIVDASDAAIASGETSAAILRKLYNRGVRLFAYSGLHAKTIVLDRTAFVSSGNLSDSSLTKLLEAGIQTDHPNVVSKAISFIDDLADHATPIKQKFLDRIAKIPVKRRGFAHGGKPQSRRKFPAEEREPKTWLIGVHAVDDPKDPAVLKRIKKGEEAAAELRANPKSSTMWLRLGRNRVAREARKGDNVVIIWRSTLKGSPEIVYQHLPVLLNQPESTCSRIFYEEFPNAEKKALPWKKFERLLKQVGLPSTISKNTTRELRSHISVALHDLWEQARGN